MTCQEFIEFLWKYLDRKLPPEQRFTFDAHMAVCPDCVNYLQNYRETVRLGQETLGACCDPVPPDVPEDLIQAILDARRQ
jgi:anti-sigma factor RsiW